MFVRRVPFQVIGALVALLWTPNAAQAGNAETSRHATPQCTESQISNASRELIQGVLEANGTGPARAREAIDKFRQNADRCRASAMYSHDARQRAQQIHRFLHREILRGNYDSKASDLAIALAGGSFNCATASTLFLALAAECDLEACVVSAPGHVWCRVKTDKDPLDVETTCPNWFELVERAASVQADEIATLWADHCLRKAGARELDQHALIAVFHYNRGVRLLDERQFPAAASANLAALQLDPGCRLAHDNLLATMNNWSLALSAGGQDQVALEMLAQGLTLAPDYEPFRANLRLLSRQIDAKRQPAAANADVSNDLTVDNSRQEPRSRKKL